MTDNPTLFDEQQAHARTADRATSHEAARSVTRLSQRQAAVYACLGNFPGGAADIEWIEEYKRTRWVTNYPPQTDSSLRTRRSELVTAGSVREIGVKRIGSRNHTIWKLT